MSESTGETGGASDGVARSRRDALQGRVLDAKALKALAHPLRVELIELLIERGPSTASELGRLLGESSGSTSYHLRQLAKEHLIEEAPELGTARDRWWRVPEGGWTLEGFDILEREETRDDAQLVLDEVVRARFQRLRRWHRDASRWGPTWVDSTIEMTARLQLTRDELEQLTTELITIVDRYRDLQAERRDPRVEHPGTVPVTVQLDAFPTGDPPEPGSPAGPIT
jgi:DNA-binding transcriptional ArsR family regulator